MQAGCCINTTHIQKLGHEIPEIRERALKSLISKLRLGYEYDNELVRCRELLEKLFDWFLFETCTNEEPVLNLIKTVLESNNGKVLIEHLGQKYYNDKLEKIRTFINRKFHPILDDIFVIDTDIPILPLESDTRSTQILQNQKTSSISTHSLTSTMRSHQIIFKWQDLCTSDQQVLESFRCSLKGKNLQQSCRFFNHVLLNDFPAEVFLQRPGILKKFLQFSTDFPADIFRTFHYFSTALLVRIHHCTDPYLQTDKTIDFHDPDPHYNSPQSGFESHKDICREEFNLGQFSVKILNGIFNYLHPNRRKGTCDFSQRTVNVALNLLKNSIDILEYIQNNSCEDFGRQDCLEILQNFGDTMQFYRLEASTTEIQNSSIIYLCLLQNCLNFLTVQQLQFSPNVHLPNVLKQCLLNSLSDANLRRIYPKTHESLQSILENFQLEPNTFSKYKNTLKICDSISATFQLKRIEHRSSMDWLNLYKSGVKSLEFSQDLQFVKSYINFCTKSEDLSQDFDEITLQLLAHNCPKIQLETYELCWKSIICTIGPKLNLNRIGRPANEILFLIRPKILLEFVNFGLNCTNGEVKKYTEDIFIHLIKARVLVDDKIWNRILECLLVILPLLLTFADSETILGQHLISILDPDTGPTLSIPDNEIFKGNCTLLFSKFYDIRAEAFSRICWMLAQQENSKVLLPRLTRFADKTLPNICHVQRIFNVNKQRNTQHLYQPSSVIQILDLLSTDNLEPVLRRSALNQLCVMMEDYLLHNTFLEKSGLQILLKIMENALNEEEFSNYPDSVISCISIMRNLCIFHQTARFELTTNPQIFYWILRGLFLYSTEDRLRLDASYLLFYLLYGDFILGSPIKADISVPFLLKSRLFVPFECNFHWETSEFLIRNQPDEICIRSLKIHYNSELFNGFENLLKVDNDEYELKTEDLTETNANLLLKLSIDDLRLLKTNSIQFSIEKLQIQIENSTNFEDLHQDFDILYSYLLLGKLCGYNKYNEKKIAFYPWASTLTRFLTVLPSDDQDLEFLTNLFDFLKLLVQFYEEPDFWLVDVLKSTSNPLLDILKIDHSDFPNNNLVNIVYDNFCEILILCLEREQCFVFEKLAKNPDWSILINFLIDENLKQYDSQNFYNLAHLHGCLGVLVHLTAKIGWSENRNFTKKIPNLNHFLWTLLAHFQNEKNTNSLMGTSIIRYTILLLNHLVLECRHIKGLIPKMFNCEDNFDWLEQSLDLVQNRDVIIRAASVHILAELSRNSNVSQYILNGLKFNGKEGVCGLALSLNTDLKEATIIRENSLQLLINTIHETNLKEINNLMEIYDFWTNAIKSITIYLDLSMRTQSFSSPCLIQNLTKFFGKFPQEFQKKLTELNMIKLILRCVSSPIKITVDSNKTLNSYCELLQMNHSILGFLTQIVLTPNEKATNTILNSRDCLDSVLQLLNPELYYYNSLPHLLYLRNQLWTTIFNFFSTLIQFERDLITDLVLKQLPLWDALIICLINTDNFNDMQNCGLIFLTNLLNCNEKITILDELKTDQILGVKLTAILMNLYQVALSVNDTGLTHITTALACTVFCSEAGKNTAIASGLLDTIMEQISIITLKLTLEPVENYRRISDKKRLHPLIENLREHLILLNNFLHSNNGLKEVVSVNFHLTDYLHKLWSWLSFDPNNELIVALKLLNTLTTNCSAACQTLVRTSSIPGTGPRRTASNNSLLHCILDRITREMDQISKTHRLSILELSFGILKNAILTADCRLVLAKNDFLSTNINRLYQVTRHRNRNFNVTTLWLDFLQVFTQFPEGQSLLGKTADFLEWILLQTEHYRCAFDVLRNCTFYQPNRPRLLASGRFLRFLHEKLHPKVGTIEKMIVVIIVWTLVANNQKAKTVLKSAGIDQDLKQFLRQIELLEVTSDLDQKEIEKVYYVYDLLMTDH